MNIYRLAVCEDDRDIRKEISRLCGEILTETQIAHEISCFSNAEKLEAALEKQRMFDVLILDIRLERMTGMELAKKLRREDNRISIIFITGCEEYLREGYEVQPVHFLLKPIEKSRLKEALLTDWKLNHKPERVTLRRGNRTLGLMLKEILYIEAGVNHNIRIVLEGREEMFPVTLSEMEQNLPAESFIRCHNSYLVNLEYVKEWNRQALQMADGVRLPVGRKYYKECQAAFISYINR